MHHIARQLKFLSWARLLLVCAFVANGKDQGEPPRPNGVTLPVFSADTPVAAILPRDATW